MTDAIDREEHAVGTADEAGQQTWAMFDAAVMMQEARASSLGHVLELGNVVRSPSYVEEGEAR